MTQKRTKESLPRVDSSVPLTYHDPRDLGLICLEKEMQNPFSDLIIQSWIFLKKSKLSFVVKLTSCYHWQCGLVSSQQRTLRSL